MDRSRRRMRLERLESRSLFAATIGIPDVILDSNAADAQVVASIEIDNAAGIRGATVEIHYDQTLLQPDMATIRAGSIWDGKGVAIANVNDLEGTITAFVFATEDMGLSSGSLLDIDFVFSDEATGNARASIGVGSLRLNEGDIPISAIPILGQPTINGSITRQGLPAGAGLSPSSVAIPERGKGLPVTAPIVGEPVFAAEPPAVARGVSDAISPQAMTGPISDREPVARLFCTPRSGGSVLLHPLAIAGPPAADQPLLGPVIASEAATELPASPKPNTSISTPAINGGGTSDAPVAPSLQLAGSTAPVVMQAKSAAAIAEPSQSERRETAGLKQASSLASLYGVRRGIGIGSSYLWTLGGRHPDDTADSWGEGDRAGTDG